MQNDAIARNGLSEGLLLLDSDMNLILVNAAAAQILVYPHKPEDNKNLGGSLAATIRSRLVSARPLNGTPLVPRFKSGRRTYSCRTFPVNGMANGDSKGSLAVLLERVSARPALLSHPFERFHLTTREEEVARFLLQGLTSKEISVRMQISPNTVKAFLHLIMIKMGVSTRSGIVGKALTQNCEQ
jgi:DNA-binding CsgD family transcriptional regulator